MRLAMTLLLTTTLLACGDGRSIEQTEDGFHPEGDAGWTLDSAQPPDQAVRLDAAPQLDIQVIKKDVPCEIPDYSQDCSQVPTFQCGFMASCNGSTITAEWHEHIFCGGDGMEQIQSYSCTYTCPGTCGGDPSVIWPQDGQELVQKLCAP